MNEVVDLLLTLPASLPPPPVNNYSASAGGADAEVPYGNTWVNAKMNPNLEGLRINSRSCAHPSVVLVESEVLNDKVGQAFAAAASEASHQSITGSPTSACSSARRTN